MAFCTSGAQQETTRKILEDLQLKKQLLQKGVASTVLPISMNQTSPVLEFAQGGSIAPAALSRTAFNPNNSSTVGFFLQQDSHYGNSFIPVLPRFDPSATPNHTAQK